MSLLVAEGLSLPGRLAETRLALEPGTLTCLIGPNGSGKTSLLHALAGIGPRTGRVEIDGVDPRSLGPGERQRLLGFLPASRDVKWPLAARDVIALGGGDPASIDLAVEALDLGALADRRIGRLSTGERSRVLIARVLAARPRVALFDEPVANLDPLWQLKLLDLLHDGMRGANRALLVAIHDLDLAGTYADRLIILDKGRIVADGEPVELLRGPHIPEVFGVTKEGGTWRPAF
ncbi:ABC transporter ATP-binding protein [Sphingosinicella sp. LY1275]|uniref:ABC transporter ATP-binding protein n=1 Tax=Sphingosinicella sp. LY1275 TaxID=3095379 RepID=UPI002ADEF1A5|nr:ABC transporter ATP-binding protein [Sphingosinicella sp. LY1275]MEA1013440.1 ABC transporter ATP-binding protein [Sphingosinicella sp. LY1275]